jgi:hypothetical protein
MFNVSNFFNVFNSTENKTKFVYLEPKRKATSILLVLFCISFFFWLILQYNYVVKNWDDVKCKKGNFYIAPLFGKNSKDTFDQCISSQIEDYVKTELEPIYNKIENVDNSINSFYDLQYNSNSETYIENNKVQNTFTNLSINMQKNILYVKNALNKILGALLLTSYMNEGAIKTTNSLEGSSFSKLIGNFNEIISSEQTQEATLKRGQML